MGRWAGALFLLPGTPFDVPDSLRIEDRRGVQVFWRADPGSSNSHCLATPQRTQLSRSNPASVPTASIPAKQRHSKSFPGGGCVHVDTAGRRNLRTHPPCRGGLLQPEDPAPSPKGPLWGGETNKQQLFPPSKEIVDWG